MKLISYPPLCVHASRPSVNRIKNSIGKHLVTVCYRTALKFDTHMRVDPGILRT